MGGVSKGRLQDTDNLLVIYSTNDKDSEVSGVFLC